MKCKSLAMIGAIIGVLAAMGGWAIAAQGKYTVKVPNGLSFSEFKGYEDWQAVGPSLTDAQHVIRLILANSVMIEAYKEGVPGNGKPFPEGSKIAKIEWRPKKLTDPPFSATIPDTVPGDLTVVEFIEKDTKRFSDMHGWGYATFDYDAVAGTFTPATLASKPPQGHDAKCGAACHTLAASRDYIFTSYARR
jgi:Cytochrome P460